MRGWGGEEFSGLLPVTGMAEAMIVAERLRKVIANAEFKMDWKSYEPIPFTISIGVAQTDSAESVAEVLKRADTALYAAKEAGRNRVIASSGACEVSEAPQLLKVVAN
ncbi:MAG: GGDEF domain-containing protein [Hyphomicrobiaceae bacterium]